MADVDFFKHINDSLGHMCGDRVLRNVADAMTLCAGPKNFVCRWGGEEFLALLFDTTATEGWAWAEKLRQSVEQMRTNWLGEIVTVTLSLGLAQSTTESDLDQVIAMADEALFMAKQQGRNQTCSWEMVARQKLAENEGILIAADPFPVGRARGPEP